MKVYSVDESVQKPVIDWSSYNWENVQKENAAYRQRVKDWLISMGYTSLNTGRELHVPMGDGYASYMFAESENKRKSFLVHLEIGDNWHSPLVEGLTKKAVLDNMARGERMNAFFKNGK